MNDLQELFKEAFMGEEPYDKAQGQPELTASIKRFERQERLLRLALWGATLLMSALCYWTVWGYYRAPVDESPKHLILLATLFLFSIQCIGWSKMFIFSNQKSVSILKELKRMQLLLLEDD